MESRYSPSAWDPTTRIHGRMFVEREDSNGKETELVLGEIQGRRFEPYLLLDLMRSEDCEAPNLFDAHDAFDQDTHELWSIIYDSDNATYFGAPWNSEVDMTHGAALVLDCVVETEFEGSNDWIAPRVIQAFLDQAEYGVNMTLVDLRYLKSKYMKQQCKLFAQFGFKRVKGTPFLMRDPAVQNPRICMRLPEEDVDATGS